MTPFVIAIRHGETDYNVRDAMLGQLDPPLNERGLGHARDIAGRLQQFPVTRIFSSPLIRARHTAEIAAAALNLPLQLDDDLMEVSFGEYDGMDGAEAERLGIRKQMYADRMNFRPPGGEAYSDVLRRVGRFFTRHRILESDGLTVIASHKGTARMIWAQLGLSPAEAAVKDFDHDSMLIASRDSNDAVHARIEE